MVTGMKVDGGDGIPSTVCADTRADSGIPLVKFVDATRG
jgi:hypothetical protein